MYLGLISCTKTKKEHPCIASEMYSVSPLFRKAYRYCVKTYNLVGILSAKYGYLPPNDYIEPYNITLNKMRREKRRSWSIRVYQQMKNRLYLRRGSIVFFHTGKRYREYLIPLLVSDNIQCKIPLYRLRIGEQLRWYNKMDLN